MTINSTLQLPGVHTLFIPAQHRPPSAIRQQSFEEERRNDVQNMDEDEIIEICDDNSPPRASRDNTPSPPLPADCLTPPSESPKTPEEIKSSGDGGNKIVVICDETLLLTPSPLLIPAAYPTPCTSPKSLEEIRFADQERNTRDHGKIINLFFLLIILKLNFLNSDYCSKYFEGALGYAEFFRLFNSRRR